MARPEKVTKLMYGDSFETASRKAGISPDPTPTKVNAKG